MTFNCPGLHAREECGTHLLDTYPDLPLDQTWLTISEPTPPDGWIPGSGFGGPSPIAAWLGCLPGSCSDLAQPPACHLEQAATGPRIICQLLVDNLARPFPFTLHLRKLYRQVPFMGMTFAWPTLLDVIVDGVTHTVLCPAAPNATTDCGSLTFPERPSSVIIGEPAPPPGWTPISGIGPVDLTSPACQPSSCAVTVVNVPSSFQIRVHAFSTGIQPPSSGARFTLTYPGRSAALDCPPPNRLGVMVGCQPAQITLHDWHTNHGPISLSEDALPHGWQVMFGPGTWTNPCWSDPDPSCPSSPPPPSWIGSPNNELLVLVALTDHSGLGNLPLRLAINKAWAGSLLPDEPAIIEVTFRGVDTATGQEHTATVELTYPATQFLVTCQPTIDPTTVLGSLALRAISIREQQTPSGRAPSDGFVTDVFEDFGSIFGGDSCRIVPEGDHLTLTCALGITNRALSQPGGGSGGGSAGAGGDHGTLGDDTGADGAGSSGSTRADRHGQSPPNPGPPPDQAGSPARQAIVPVSPPTTTDAESSRSGRESEPAVSGYQLLPATGRPQVSRPALFWLILGLVNAAIGLQLGRRGTTRTR